MSATDLWLSEGRASQLIDIYRPRHYSSTGARLLTCQHIPHGPCYGQHGNSDWLDRPVCRHIDSDPGSNRARSCRDLPALPPLPPSPPPPTPLPPPPPLTGLLCVWEAPGHGVVSSCQPPSETDCDAQLCEHCCVVGTAEDVGGGGGGRRCQKDKASLTAAAGAGDHHQLPSAMKSESYVDTSDKLGLGLG